MKYLMILSLLMTFIFADEIMTLSPIDIVTDTQIIDTKETTYFDDDTLKDDQVQKIEALCIFISSLSISNYGSHNVAFTS